MTRTTIRSEDITAGQVKSADLASDAVDTTSLETDIALLGFKVAANGSLAAYNLKNQTIDSFEDASGIDASGSTNETRNASNYYSGTETVTPTVTGGTITTDGDYKVHSFSSSGNLVTDATLTADLLLVGGGGAGAGRVGAGGGGGGVVYVTSYSIPSGTHAVTVGAGGTGVTEAGEDVGEAGGNTVFASTITALGGGGGDGYYQAVSLGGGSGGGGAYGADGGSSTQSSQNSGISNLTQYGNSGGGSVSAPHYNWGGGGGAGAAGTDGTSSTLGNGGNGIANSITGSSVTYGGGGGGGQHGYTDTSAWTTSGGQGGTGGGAGCSGYGNRSGEDGTDGLGGGGSGAQGYGSNSYRGGHGGDGVLIVRRSTSATGTADLTLVSNATTADSAPTTGDIVMTYTNGAGTATVNTDIKAWISRDNGTTYTQATLTSEGTTGGHSILTAHNVDISSQPSGTSMRYKITTHNQSSSKETRIQAVSLGWS